MSTLWVIIKNGNYYKGENNMDNSLVMYPNLQFNPIEIPEFTLVEFYKESIAVENDAKQ